MIDFHTDFTDFTEDRIATLAAVGFAECLQPAGKRECNDAFFVIFVKSVWDKRLIA